MSQLLSAAVALAWSVAGIYTVLKGDVTNGLLMLLLGELCSVQFIMRENA